MEQGPAGRPAGCRIAPPQPQGSIVAKVQKGPKTKSCGAERKGRGSSGTRGAATEAFFQRRPKHCDPSKRNATRGLHL